MDPNTGVMRLEQMICHRILKKRENIKKTGIQMFLFLIENKQIERLW